MVERIINPYSRDTGHLAFTINEIIDKLNELEAKTTKEEKRNCQIGTL